MIVFQLFMRRVSTALLAATLLPSMAGAVPVETELSLLVDTSGSISDTEFALQVESYSQHVRDPDVVPHDGSIALNMVFFSTTAAEVIPWTWISDAAAANAFADLILALPRDSGSTALGDGLITAAATFVDNGFEGTYRVIDVSGDGAVNHGTDIDTAQAQALSQVDTINGLAISDGDPSLVDYYRDEVRGGPSSFVYEVLSHDTFADALRAKLRREVRLCVAPPDTTLGWWAFDEIAGNVSLDQDEGHDGIHAGCPEPTPGQVAGALRFDGSDDRVVVAAAESLQVGTSDLTVMAWMRTAAGAGLQPIVDARDAATLRGWSFHLRDGRPALQLADGNGTTCDDSPASACSEYISSVNIADGAWHFVAVVVDRDAPDGGRFLVDGLPAGSFDPTPRAGSLSGGTGLLFGASHPLPEAAWYEGDLDELAVIAERMPDETLLEILEDGVCSWNPRMSAEAPVIELCLWPPNHRMHCASVASLLDLGLPADLLTAISCVSDQPDDDRGDGNTTDDCVITDDGKGICVRGERSGRGGAGRSYSVTISLSQDCGAAVVAVLRLVVPHDRSSGACEPSDAWSTPHPHD